MYMCVWDHMGKFIFSWEPYWVSLRLQWGSQTARLGKDHAMPEAKVFFCPCCDAERWSTHAYIHTISLTHKERVEWVLCTALVPCLCADNIFPLQRPNPTQLQLPRLSVWVGEKRVRTQKWGRTTPFLYVTLNCLLRLCQNGSHD